FEVDAHARGFEGPPTRVDLVGIVSEEREVARVAARGDPRRDRIDEPIHAVRREPVQVRLRRGLERRLVAELDERSVPQAIENHEEGLSRIHFSRRRSGPWICLCWPHADVKTASTFPRRYLPPFDVF